MIRCLRLVLVAGLFTAAGNAQAQEPETAPAPEAEEAVLETAAVPGEPSMDDSIGAAMETAEANKEYNRQLLTLEEDVNLLKEQVFRSKATLQLLKEIVIQGRSTGSRASVWHVNRLGPAYTLRSVSFYLDGQSIHTKSDPSGSLDISTEMKVWEGVVPPGNHNLTVSAVLQGNGFGVFSYVENYTFNVKSSYAFLAEDNSLASVRVVLDERRGVGRSFVERPQVVYEVQTSRLAVE
jgi:hypothetical protein